ncbi:glycosyltransferase family 4 protein [Edaphobacter dinghuensis]|nr:glycosyltransferase family 4 protein [Edaphobacter dinghuensis]
MRDSAVYENNRGRIDVVTEQQIANMKVAGDCGPSVFMTRGTDLAAMARLRRIGGCSRAPIVGAIHSINYSWQLRAVMMLLVARLNSFDALVCSSSAGHTAMLRFIDLLTKRLKICDLPALPAEFKMPIIPLGVDTDRFEKFGQGEIRKQLSLSSGPILLYFGRFSPTSKADLLPLIAAFQQVVRKTPDATLLLAGDDTHHHMSGQLQKLATFLDITDNVRVIANPDLSMKRRLFGEADIFVSPSDSLQETFGITLIEAMAAGLPCVVSDWNGYKDIVSDGETGFLIPTTIPIYPSSFDDLRGSGAMVNVDLLAATTIVDWPTFINRVCTLLSDVDLRKRMGIAARNKAKLRYDWSVVIKDHEALWDELIDEAARRNGVNENKTLDLDSFGYREIFSHYSTDELSDDRVVSTTSVTGSPELPFSMLRDTLPWFQEDVFLAIDAIIKKTGTTTIGEILRDLGKGGELEEISHIAHLSRMIKYGLLKFGD